MPSSLTHRPLNTKQLLILRTLYRFRFATTELLTHALDTKSKIKMNERLKLLLDQGYIGRKFEPEYHLLRKHAVYFLMPKGIKALKELGEEKYVSRILKNIRNDKIASDEFIEGSLTIFDIYCRLKAQYRDALRFFTQSQLATYEGFTRPLPSAYIRIDPDGEDRQFFLEYFDASKSFFAAAYRIGQYIKRYSASDAADSPPVILLVCENVSLMKQLLKRMQRATEKTDNEELLFCITSSTGFKGATDLDKDKFWHDIALPDEKLSLASIS